MGTLHRPQLTTPVVYYPREFYYGRPQRPFSHPNIPPEAGTAIVQTLTLTAIVQTGTLTAIVQTGTS